MFNANSSCSFSHGNRNFRVYVAQNGALLAFASSFILTVSHLFCLTFQLTKMSRNLSPKSRRTAHPPAATEEAPSHDRRLQHEKSVRFEGDEGDIDEEEEEDEGLGVSSGGDSSPANGERDQVGEEGAHKSQ